MEWYDLWSMNGQLPFAGAWMDQPYYVRKNLIYYQKLEEWHKQNAKRPSLEGLPRLENES